MSKFNALIYLNAYDDYCSTNNPARNQFRWNRSLNSLLVSSPVSMDFSLAPGQTLSVFSGARTLSQDSTTEYSIALKPFTTNTYVLSNSGGTAPNFRTSRSTGADSTTHVNVSLNGPLATFASIPGAYASFIGQVAGMMSSVTITANNVGTVGNSVSLSFNGSTSINSEISTWNTANPSNQVTLTSGDGTQIPSNSTIINLSGGATYTQFNLSGVQVGDSVFIGSNFNALNQGFYQVLSSTTTSFTVENQIAVAEGPIALGSGFVSQVQIYSAAGVQVGDTLLISGGFSSVIQGSYQITAVYAESLEFSSLQVLPSQGPVMTEAIAIYFDSKQLIYVESDQNVDLTINGVDGGTIEPFVQTSGNFPGMFLRKSTIYSLSVTNTSDNTANLFFAAVG